MLSSSFSISAMDYGMKTRKRTAPVIKMILMTSYLWLEAGETLLLLWNLSILQHQWSPSMSTSLSSRQPSGGRALAAYHSFHTGPASPHTDLREVNVMACLGFKEQTFVSHRIILLKPCAGCSGDPRGYWMLLLLSEEIGYEPKYLYVWTHSKPS